MISKAKAKFIKSLQIKKYRKEEQCFVVEGAKSVQELLASDFEVLELYATDHFLEANDTLIRQRQVAVEEVKEKELSVVGSYQSNNAALAVVACKPDQELTVESNEYLLALDDVNDPGNLGTIIRTADWYGINKIVASESTVDIYNPKVIAASKGSFTRVTIHYSDLTSYLKGLTIPVYGAYLEGENLHSTKFDSSGILLMGSESNGISSNLEHLVTHKVSIPRYGGAESLNVGMATAIFCDNLRRNIGKN
ncbi:MAG: RNA methyltransferase [Bacteroidota bacterium]